MELIEILGMRYPTNNKTRRYKFGLYKCTCGKTFEKRITKALLTSKCASCAKSVARTHGKTGTRLYNIWRNMKNRCEQRVNKHKSHENYTNNNINVCDSWKNSFEVFQNWAINNGYKSTLSIDRINGKEGYYPNNCRWATAALQAQNTVKLRSTNTSGYRGVNWVKNRNKFAAEIKVNNKKIWIGSYVTAIEAAIAYDSYIITNNLQHTINDIQNTNYEGII